MNIKKWAGVISTVASVVCLAATAAGNWAKDVNTQQELEKMLDKKLKEKGM